MQNNLKFLVTGGAGFIGSNIVKELLKQDYQVRVVDNLSTGNIENIQTVMGQIEFFKGDLSELSVARQALKDIDIVFHEAAVPSVQRSIADPLSVNAANINATLNVLAAARESKIKKLVYASSSSVYGNAKTLPKRETDPIDPISPYALTKFVGERYCQLFNKLYGLPTICLRYFNVFGPSQNAASQYSAVIPKFITAILNGESPIVYGDGEQSRDFTYVDNVVSANILAAFSDADGEVVNIACNERITLNQIVETINKHQGTTIAPNHAAEKPGDIKHSLADISKAQKLIGYKPLVLFESGLQKTIEWYKLKLKK
ncbi:MAG: SDR family oxidoreductase [Parcubacteria group bacterium]